MPYLYDTIGKSYAKYRRPDPSIAAAITSALGDTMRVVNIGAGTGSYEPTDRNLVAVEPSETMIRQRPANAAPIVRASAMALPFSDDAFDAALAVLSVHHWPDQPAGLREMSRVAKRCVIFTWDPLFTDMWLTRDYFPEIAEKGKAVCPPLDSYAAYFEHVEILTVAIPHDCSDGFLQAYWRRPEMYFDGLARMAISAFAVIDAQPGLQSLRRDLDNGTWVRRNSHLLDKTELDLGFRLVIGERP
jgi:SAM-dependent methyltransferase